MTTSTPKRRGFSVRVFLPDGDPDGIKTVEKSNWNGSGLVIPRALFADANARAEFGRAGVYMLVGPDETTSLPRMYVGEGDPVRPRIEQHVKHKDFWTHAVVFTSKDQNLNKAHIQHLEARLIGLATTAKRSALDNGNTPAGSSLSEADAAEAEGFLDDVLLCLPVLGFRMFEVPPRSAPRTRQLTLRAKGIEARGHESAQGFVVLKGSTAVKNEAPSIHAYLSDLRAQLVTQGVLANRGKEYELTQDYAFASPSGAAGVMLGRSANGRIEWSDSDGKTLKAIQEAEGR
jgi:hypothetical protein